MSKGYNGWSNWETWKWNLEMVDSDWAEEVLTDAGNVDDAAERFENDAYEALDSWLPKELRQGTFYGIITAFFQDVDWREIAEHHKPTEWGEHDEAPEDPDEDEDLDDVTDDDEEDGDKEGETDGDA